MRRTLFFLLIAGSMILMSGCQTVANFLPTQTPYPTYTPNPTHTPYPTFTPIPSPTATPEKTVLFMADDFSNVDSCFPVFSDNFVRVYADDGELHLFTQELNYFVWSYCDEEYRNFILDVDVTAGDGPINGDYAFGVIVRNNESDGEFYAFMIGADGYYNFSYYYLGEFVEDYPILNWSVIREIKQGRTTNHIRVVALGEQFEFYVNGELVGLVRDGVISSGSVGFIVKTFDSPGAVDVSFDNLVITEP